MDFCQKLSTGLWNLSTIQNKLNTILTGLHPHRRCTNNMSFCKFFHGPHHRPSPCRQIRFHLGHGRPRPFKGGNFITLHPKNHIRGHSQTTFGRPIQMFGLLDKIISNQGPQFASKAFTELLKLLGIKSALSTAYHSQTDGTTEQVNQEIEAYLLIYCASHPEDWPKALHIMEFTHNN